MLVRYKLVTTYIIIIFCSIWTAIQVFTRLDSCSSPDLLDEADPNSNSRTLDVRECSDDDNLDTLDRKVSAIVNGNRFTDVQTDNGNASDGDLLRVTRDEDLIFRQNSSETQLSVDSIEDVCEWSDEEGDLPVGYPSLRRKR